VDEVLRQAGNGVLVYTFLVSFAFCVAYQLYARWRATEFGRSLMLYQIAMTTLLGFIAIRLVGLDTGPLVRLVVFTVIPIALTWRLVVLIKVQRGMRKEDHK
jgi:hypothetical protein